MVGTWINVAGIVLGSICGLLWRNSISTSNQLLIKVLLGALLALSGLRLAWVGLSAGGSFGSVLKHLLLAVVALAVGRLTGRLMHLQKGSNWLGQYARRKMTELTPEHPHRFSDGFTVCTLLFCAAPLGIVGALSDGLDGYFFPLALKGVMDGLGAMSFVAMFGAGVVLSSVPLLLFQGLITLAAARYLLPLLEQHNLLHPVQATAGLLIFCVSIVVFEIKKIEVTDYLPSLAVAPLIAFWLK